MNAKKRSNILDHRERWFGGFADKKATTEWKNDCGKQNKWRKSGFVKTAWRNGKSKWTKNASFHWQIFVFILHLSFMFCETKGMKKRSPIEAATTLRRSGFCLLVEVITKTLFPFWVLRKTCTVGFWSFWRCYLTYFALVTLKISLTFFFKFCSV